MLFDRTHQLAGYLPSAAKFLITFKPMKMKKIFLLFAVIMLSISIVKAQTGSSYTNALGVKIYPGAVSYKHFFSAKNAGELLGYFWNNGFRATGLYEIHSPINNAAGLQWYIGPGAHVGVFNTKYKNVYPGA